MKPVFWNLLACGALLTGCASVNVISPVAELNKSNAEALYSNIQVFVAIDDGLFKATLASHRNLAYTEVIAAVQANERPTSTPIDKFYKDKADALKKEVLSLEPSAQGIQIAKHHRTQPLAAAIAFGNLEPAAAAQKWTAFEAISRASSQDRVELNRALFRDLPGVVAADRHANDLENAQAKLRKAVLDQTAVSLQIARQLATASGASPDPAVFLKGVAEDPRTLASIAEYVAGSTDSQTRKKAAEDLLKALSDGPKK